MAELTHEQCKEIVEAGLLKFQKAATLDCRINRLTLHVTGQQLPLSEPQKRLLVCLFKGITCKRKIINIVWYEYHQRISDNNYHQLVFQLRTLLKQHRLPAQLVLTVPYFGLRINEPLLLSLTAAELTSQPDNQDSCIAAAQNDDSANDTSPEQTVAAELPRPESAPDTGTLRLQAMAGDDDLSLSGHTLIATARSDDVREGSHERMETEATDKLLVRLKSTWRSCFGFCLLVLV